MMFATWTASPLASRFVVRIAVNAPVDVGRVEKVIVKVVAVAAVTVPIAPLLKTTLLLAAIVEKPKPVIVMVVVVMA